MPTTPGHLAPPATSAAHSTLPSESIHAANSGPAAFVDSRPAPENRLASLPKIPGVPEHGCSDPPTALLAASRSPLRSGSPNRPSIAPNLAAQPEHAR